MIQQNRNKSGGNNLRLTVDDLTGKQSVRATFRLPQQLIDLLLVFKEECQWKIGSRNDSLVSKAHKKVESKK